MISYFLVSSLMSNCVCEANPLSEGTGSGQAKEGQFHQQALRQLKPFFVSIFVVEVLNTLPRVSWRHHKMFDIEMPRVSWGTTHVHGHRGTDYLS